MSKANVAKHLNLNISEAAQLTCSTDLSCWYLLTAHTCSASGLKTDSMWVQLSKQTCSWPLCKKLVSVTTCNSWWLWQLATACDCVNLQQLVTDCLSLNPSICLSCTHRQHKMTRIQSNSGLTKPMMCHGRPAPQKQATSKGTNFHNEEATPKEK